MNEQQLFSLLVKKFSEVLKNHHMESEEIVIKARGLTPQEAIGKTKRTDYPILTGREIMLEAEYKGAKGQAFTSAPSGFQGTLNDILQLDIETDHHARGLFIAAMNAVMKFLELTDRTVHCRESEPEECAREAVSFIRQNYGHPRIALVGYQPALLENLAAHFPLRVLDLNPENIGQKKYGITVKHGEKDFDEVVKDWAELVLCTGSTLCNGTIVSFLDLDKEVLFFGTTLAGAAELLGCKRLCFCAQ